MIAVRTRAESRGPAYLCLAAAMGITGSSVVAAKVMACRLPVFLSSACSLALAGLVLYMLSPRRASGISARDALFLAVQALTGVFLFRVALFHGLKSASAMEAGITVSALPALTSLISLLFLGERMTCRKAAGIILAVSGLLLVNVPGVAPQAAGGHLGASLSIAGAVLGEALFTVVQKKVRPEVPPITAAALICFWALIVFLPGAVMEALHYDLRTLRPADCLFIAYYGLIVTALGYVLFIKGARVVPAGTAGMFYGLVPISSTLLSAALLGESLGWRFTSCLILVLLGIVLTEKPDPISS